jgi:hypothetical protein
MKNMLKISDTHHSNLKKGKTLRGLKLGVMINKLETFADIKQGRFRRLFNRHLKPYGF